MKHILIPLLALCASAVIAADPGEKKTTTTTTKNGDGTATTSTTTTTTTSTGTITEYAPGQTFVVKETSGPVSYHYGKSVVYATKTGRILTEDQVRTRIKIGLPVSVHYITEGENRVIRRVEVDDK